MTLGISDEHVELHRTVERWVTDRDLLGSARASLDAEAAARPAFWDDLVARGWIGIGVSEASGGEGFGLLEAMVVAEELGRGMAPGPAIPTMAAAMVMDRFGEGIGAELEAVLAGAPAAVGFGVDPVPVRPGKDGSLVIESAIWSPVLGGATAEILVLPVVGADAPVWVVVPRSAVDVREQSSVDPTRPMAEVRVDRLVAAPNHQVRSPQRAIGVAELTLVLLAAEAVGLMDWCVRTAAAYACDRVQFGRPIGQFQAVKHRCADMVLALEQSKAAVWDAGREGDGPDALLAAEVVGAVVPAAAFGVAKDCIQVHGGIGFTWEHDAHLFLRRAQVIDTLAGGRAPWRSRAAAQAVGGVRRSMSFDLPAEADALRPEVRAVVESVQARPKAEWNAAIADAGYLVPAWPRPWGVDAGPLHQLVIDEELARARIRRPHLAVGMWVLPTLIGHGTEAQQQRFIPPTLRQEISWCQLFSEPGAGSDLAALRTRAERVDGGWELTGQKVWTTLAHQADWGICLARSDPDAPRHDGITCFLLDMGGPGIDIRPLRELTGQEMFNEVFLDHHFVPDECVVGAVDGGWSAARTTLANERVSMGSGSSFGPGVEAVLELATRSEDGNRRIDDARIADRIGGLVADGQSISALGTRLTLRALVGRDAGAESSVRKLLGVEHDQEVQEVGLALLGSAGTVIEDDGAVWVHGFLGNRALSIAGGTSEIQRNVIGERILGLPKDA